ncbi:hypothetical protein GCM10027294_54070 [Marinactinospora endophytica]
MLAPLAYGEGDLVARVTGIRTAAQGDYRLRAECGADRASPRNAATEYRIASGRPVVRVGSGWAALGRQAGTAVSVTELDEVRALMVGAHPDTGGQLVRAKTRTTASARLPAAPMLSALDSVALPADSWAGRRIARMARGVERDPSHAVAVRDLERVARAAGVNLAKVYAPADLARARQHADERQDSRVRGWDLTLDCPKSVSVLWALSSPQVATRVERAYMAAVRDVVAAAEKWCGQGQRGAHGRGRRARRVATEGFTATIALHTTARPVKGVSDPHLHAHVLIPNVALGADGRWGGIAAGGRELYRAVPALGELHRARLRAHLAADLGPLRWERDERTQQWELAEIRADLRDLYSRRRDQAVHAAGPGASAAQRRAAARRTVEPKDRRTPEEHQRAEWAARAAAAGHTPDQTAAVLSSRGEYPQDEPQAQRADRIAAQLWARHPVAAMAHPHVIAAVARDAPHGIDARTAEDIAEAVAARSQSAGGTAGGAHLRWADRWQAPRLSAADARAGRGLHSRAAAPTMAALRASQALAEARVQAARAELAELDALAGRLARWRAGMSRSGVEERRAAVSIQLGAAMREGAAIGRQIEQAQHAAIRADLGMTEEQDRAARRRHDEALVRAVLTAQQPRPGRRPPAATRGTHLATPGHTPRRGPAPGRG